ncbi:MAG: hypothetical protein GTO24_17995 [candidate division Zixibacteria bacterium]|nr:hypothetical protein [candidate division Zixibacteria bacterium]
MARMQMSRGMRIGDAKAYVAEKLGVSPLELSDPVVMNEVRDDLRLGMVRDLPGMAKGIESKFRIAEVLGIEINCLQRFRERSGLKV